MSINNIQLKAGMLADLYKSSLVETSATTMPESRPMKYLGDNKKNILVIISNQDVLFLGDEELRFLSNILTACKLSIADIGIINQHTILQNDLQNIIDSEAKNILLFGVQPLSIGLPINFPAFQLQQFNNRTYLHAPALSQIERDKELKTRLWSALKVLFKV